MNNITVTIQLNDEDYAQYLLHKKAAIQMRMNVTDESLVTWALKNFMQRYPFEEKHGIVIAKEKNEDVPGEDNS